MGKKTKQKLENVTELTMPLGDGDGSTPQELDAGPPRAVWDSKIQYFFMVISYAVGLGNVWRFPYLCQQHGGGAFLLPYLVMLFVEGMPLLYLELAIGQRIRKGSLGVWNHVHPLMGGVGVASAVTSFVVGIYYNAIIMWCFFYLFHSFQSPLPWASCPKLATNLNITDPECTKGGETSYFWYREALNISDGFDSPQGVNWKMLLCLLFAWIVVYACLFKGIKSSGKVVYFTATFPYIVLAIFFGRGITLRGATDGLLHMFTPKMDRLMDPQVWLDAATQIFYSFGLAFGGLIAFSSYNPSKNNVQKDAIIVGLCNWFTAIFACAVIFSVLGFKATVMYEGCVERNVEYLTELYPAMNFSGFSPEMYQHLITNNVTFMNHTGLEVCDLQTDLNTAAEGTGLAFIVFTQAINEFGPSAPFWSIIFFLMLLSLGLGSEFGTIEGVATSLYDLELFPWMKKKWLVSGLLCIVSCCIGFVFVLGSGAYWVALFDTFAGSFPLITVALAETIGVAYVYGIPRFSDDIEYMIGSRPNIYWRIVWRYISPVLITVLLLSTLIRNFTRQTVYKVYNKSTGVMDEAPYPWYTGVIAALLIFSSVLCIPGVAILRKCGCLKYDRAKANASETGGHTSSTMAFIRSTSTVADDNDSGHNSEEVIPEETECLNGEPKRIKVTLFDNDESPI